MKAIALWTLTALIAVTASPASAMQPLYVDKFGADTNSCSRNQPCLTIGEALSRARNYGRIIVGPGAYVEQIDITQTGLRITSTQGAEVTTIDTSDGVFFFGTGININADRVVFGQRDRGFNVNAGGAEGAIYAAGNFNRIEGNKITIRSSQQAVTMLGNGLVFRFNEIKNMFNGSAGMGLFMSRPVVNQAGGTGWLADNNYVIGFDDAYVFTSNSVNNRMRVTNNTADGAAAAFSVNNQIVIAGQEQPSQSRSGDRHSNNNVLNLKGVGGSGYSLNGGDPKVDRLRIRVGSEMDVGVSFRSTRDAMLSNSTVVGESVAGANANDFFSTRGLSLSQATATRIIRNSFINTDLGITVRNDVTTAQVVNNNIWGSANCALTLQEGISTSNLVFRQNFWGDISGPDLGCNPTSQTLLDGGFIRFAPRRLPN